MNLSLAMPTLMRRAALAAVAAGTLLGTSCTIFPPPASGPEGPPFAPEGRHRFGHNGTQSPNYPDPREDRDPGNSPPPPREIRRDPNNTDINLEPPPPRTPKEKPEPKDPGERVTPPDSTPPPPAPTPPAPKPSAVEDLPYGVPVPGQPGIVYSPYPGEGKLDVTGFKRGTRVRLKGSTNHFRVP